MMEGRKELKKRLLGREEGTEEEVIGKRRLGEEGEKGRGDISEGEESIIYNNRVYNV